MAATLTFTLPSEYGYVLAAALSTVPVAIWQGFLVSAARKAAGVAYPNAYASHDHAEKDAKAKQFNCAQRASTNYIEHLTPHLTLLLISSIKYPLFSAAAGALWTVARIMYTVGYTSAQGPKGRSTGYRASLLAWIALLGGATVSVYSVITGQ